MVTRLFLAALAILPLLVTSCAMNDGSQDPSVQTSDNTPFRSEPLVSDFYNSSYEESLYSPFSFN